MLSADDMLERFDAALICIDSYQADLIEKKQAGFDTDFEEKMIEKYRRFAEHWKGRLDSLVPNWEVVEKSSDPSFNLRRIHF